MVQPTYPLVKPDGAALRALRRARLTKGVAIGAVAAAQVASSPVHNAAVLAAVTAYPALIGRAVRGVTGPDVDTSCIRVDGALPDGPLQSLDGPGNAGSAQVDFSSIDADVPGALKGAVSADGSILEQFGSVRMDSMGASVSAPGGLGSAGTSSASGFGASGFGAGSFGAGSFGAGGFAAFGKAAIIAGALLAGVAGAGVGVTAVTSGDLGVAPVVQAFDVTGAGWSGLGVAGGGAAESGGGMAGSGLPLAGLGGGVSIPNTGTGVGGAGPGAGGGGIGGRLGGGGPLVVTADPTAPLLATAPGTLPASDVADRRFAALNGTVDVPEPASVLTLLFGVGGAMLARRRGRRG